MEIRWKHFPTFKTKRSNKQLAAQCMLAIRTVVIFTIHWANIYLRTKTYWIEYCVDNNTN
jgi:hypothetical protein